LPLTQWFVVSDSKIIQDKDIYQNSSDNTRWK
jgi:hypothetical protein